MPMYSLEDQIRNAEELEIFCREDGAFDEARYYQNIAGALRNGQLDGELWAFAPDYDPGECIRQARMFGGVTDIYGRDDYAEADGHG